MSSLVKSSFRRVLILFFTISKTSPEAPGTPSISRLYLLLYCSHCVILHSFNLWRKSLHPFSMIAFSYPSFRLSLAVDRNANLIPSNDSFMKLMLFFFLISRALFCDSRSRLSRRAFISSFHSCLNPSRSLTTSFVIARGKGKDRPLV